MARFAVALTMSVIAASLAGCSGRVQNTIELTKHIFNTPEDITLSAEEIQAYPYAAHYIKIDGQTRALMALAFDDNNVLKWRTGGEEVLMTRHGRLVGSVNMNHGPSHTTQLQNDPLGCLQRALRNKQSPSACPTKWQRQIWVSSATPVHLSDTVYALSSRFELLGNEAITLENGYGYSALKVREVSVPEPNAEHISSADITFENTFWLDTQSGRTLKSQQFISPVLGYAALEEVKPYGKHMKTEGQQ